MEESSADRQLGEADLYEKEVAPDAVVDIDVRDTRFLQLVETNDVTTSCSVLDAAALGDRAHVIHSILTPEECAAAIELGESLDMVPAHSRLSYRNNLRVEMRSTRLADALYRRALPHIAPRVEITPENCEQFPFGRLQCGVWEAVSLNHRFRLCKYHPGGHFGPHYDAEYAPGRDERSLLTFMVYLNAEYSGGETNFISDALAHADCYDEALRIYRAPASAVVARLKAAAGDAVAFRHKILHEGAPVVGHCKYILRSEVMYRRTPPPATSPGAAAQAEAEQLLMDAHRLEADGDYAGAVAKYRRAFRLCPELEKLS